MILHIFDMYLLCVCGGCLFFVVAVFSGGGENNIAVIYNFCLTACVGSFLNDLFLLFQKTGVLECAYFAWSVNEIAGFVAHKHA